MIRFIAAIDQKRGIAKEGRIPWHLPTDEQYFLQKTSQDGGVVLMGRATFEAIGHPLKERRNIVISKSLGPTEGIEVMNDLQQALHVAKDVWVIGGAAIFEQTLSFADELYITRIETDENCDRFFPEFEKGFELTSKSKPRHENGLTFRFCKYRRHHDQKMLAS